jgi:uncharacterized protein YhaN
MWIESIELEGFGNLTGEKIEFREDRLNLVLEGNEYGKSTIAEAIWAVLYDYPPGQRTSESKLKERDARKPLAAGTFKACLDIVHKDRKLRVVRDFNEKTVRVFDRSKGDSEVTTEFLSGPNRDDVGLKLTGMSRDLFRRTCFVGQRELAEYGFAGDLDLSALLQSIADGSGSATTTAATALSALDDALSHFSYMGKKYKVDRLVAELSARRDELAERVTRLEADRARAGEDLKRLAELEKALADEDKRIKSAEYFHLCLEAAELDSRLMKAQERLLRVSDLKRQLGELSGCENFPIERYRKVQELWTTRFARLSDYERLKGELDAKEKHARAREMEIRERWEGLSQFSTDDGQMIASTARTLQNVLIELEEAEQKRKGELEQVKLEKIDLDNLSGVRRALLNLDARDIDDAYAYNAMINSAREQIGECERSVWRARMIQQEIDEQRKTKAASYRNIAILLAFVIVFLAAVYGGVVVGLKLAVTHPISIGAAACALGAVITLAVNCFLMLQARAYRLGDYERAREDEQRQSALGQELHSKIMGLEIKLEDIARKAGVSNGAELVKFIQTYATAAPRLKDLDLLEQLVLSRQTHVIKLRGELESYFEKSGRNPADATPENALKLVDDINSYHDELRAFQSSTGLLDHKSSEVTFLQDQIRDLDVELKDHFQQARVPHAEEVELGYKEFLEAAQKYRRWEGLKTELERMHQDTTSDLVAGELPAIIERLQVQRDNAWATMQEIVARCPDLGDSPPPDLDPKNPNLVRELAALKADLEELRRERDELAVRVRAATKEYDDHYVSTVEELELLEHDLANINRSRAALELARSAFSRMSEETHTHWSARLNEIAKHMLSALSTDYEDLHFDAELRLTARRRGQTEPLQTAHIRGQLSGGTREQLHLLARLAVSLYLSHEEPLPIILDEPFSESDDERFLRMMRFILTVLVKRHQVILFTCHESRHNWLLDKLESEHRDLIEVCRLKPSAVSI